MKSSTARPFGLRAIIWFYAVGVAIGAITLFSNREATGSLLARVHGMPQLPAISAIAITLVMGVLVMFALQSGRPWGFWLVSAYMVFLIVVPAYTLGPREVSRFANIAWPLFVLVYLWFNRREFRLRPSA